MGRSFGGARGATRPVSFALIPQILPVLAGTNLYYVDSRTSSKTAAARIAAENGISTASNLFFIDDQDDEEYIKGRLLELLKISSTKAMSLAIAHCRPKTYRVLARHLPALTRKGYRFAFASELVE